MDEPDPFAAPLHANVLTSQNACDAISKRGMRRLELGHVTLINDLQSRIQGCIDKLLSSVKLTPAEAVAAQRAVLDLLTHQSHVVLIETHEVQDRVRRRHEIDVRLLKLFQCGRDCSEVAGLHFQFGRDHIEIRNLTPQVYIRAHTFGRYMVRAEQPMEVLQRQLIDVCALAHFLAIPLSREPDRLMAIAIPEGILFAELTPGCTNEGYTYLYYSMRRSDYRASTTHYSRVSQTREMPDIEFVTFYGMRDLGREGLRLYARLLVHQERVAASARTLFDCEFLGYAWPEAASAREQIYADWEAAANLIASAEWQAHIRSRAGRKVMPATKRAEWRSENMPSRHVIADAVFPRGPTPDACPDHDPVRAIRLAAGRGEAVPIRHAGPKNLLHGTRLGLPKNAGETDVLTTLGRALPDPNKHPLRL